MVHTLRRIRGRWLVAILVVAGAALPAHALKFAKTSQGNLLVYDCGRVGFENERAEGACKPHETSFAGPNRPNNNNPHPYDGDAATLERILSANSYPKIILFSGGGNLAEGIKLGEVLRRHRTYVVVPDKARCVSACTVAFLGGMLREVSEGGSYQVHAYSGVTRPSVELLQKMMGPEGERHLAEWVRESADAGKSFAIRLLHYAQTMLNGRPNDRAYLDYKARESGFYADYLASGQLTQLHQRIQTEGVGAVQDILMTIERDAFNAHLAQLAQRTNDLGDRSQAAVEVLNIMFASRIQSTYEIDSITLREKGYTNVRR